MEHEVRTLGRMKAICTDHVGAYWEIGKGFGHVHQTAEERGIPMNVMIGVYFDNPDEVPADQLRSKAGLIVDPDFEGEIGDLHFWSPEPGEYVVAKYVGPYDKMFPAWMELMNEIVPGMGREHSPKPGLEFYLHHDEENPENCVTELWAPVL